MPDITTAYNTAIEFCNDDNITYNDQVVTRDSIYYHYFKHSSDYGQCDCSSFIYYALMAGGWDLSYPCYWDSATMQTALLDLGFKKYNFQYGFNLEKGDVLTTNGKGHTEMVYKGGDAYTAISMGAHDYPSAERTIAQTVSINSGTVSGYGDWAFVFRYQGGDVEDSKKLSTAICAGILGNALVESYLRPSERQGGGDLSATDFKDTIGLGGGLFQWTNSEGSLRLYNLYQYASYNLQQVCTFEVQANWLVDENMWAYRTSRTPYYPWDNLQEFLSETDESEETADLSAWAFQNAWEIGTGWNDYDNYYTALKRKYAVEIYNYLKDHYNDDVKEIIDNAEICEWTDTKKNNAVFFYQLLNGKLGGYTSTTSNENSFIGDNPTNHTVKTSKNTYLSSSELYMLMGFLLGLFGGGIIDNAERRLTSKQKRR